MKRKVKNPQYDVKDLVGLNAKHRRNLEIREKVGDFFGPKADQTHVVRGVIKRNNGWYYQFDGSRVYPIEWFDKPRHVPWKLIGSIIALIIIPLLAALIQREDIFKPFSNSQSSVGLTANAGDTKPSTTTIPTNQPASSGQIITISTPYPPIPIKCGEIIDAEIARSHAGHTYNINLAPGDKIEVKGDPVGDYMNITVEIFSPTGNKITSATFPSMEDITTGVMSERGNYTLYVQSENTGLYTLYIECTLRDGTVIAPGDVVNR